MFIPGWTEEQLERVIHMARALLRDLHSQADRSRFGVQLLGARGSLEEDHGWIGGMVGQARYWGELGNAAQVGLTAHRKLLRRPYPYLLPPRIERSA